MKWVANLLFGPRGSLQRKIFRNILLALLVTVPMSLTYLVIEFFEYLDKHQRLDLQREAHEIFGQIDPSAPDWGFVAIAPRFTRTDLAYRYTLFGNQVLPLIGTETSPVIRAGLEDLQLNSVSDVDVGPDRRGVGLCGVFDGQHICVLVSTRTQLSDRVRVEMMLEELQEQVESLVLGALAVLLAAMLAARLSMRPLARVQAEAQDINPNAADRRLNTAQLPAEMVPLVQAVNDAFARLEQGYRAQQDFSSNVAHEVRTPLAVLKSRIEHIADATLRQDLSADLDRLTTLFEQLIDLARADALGAESFGPVNLHDLALQVSQDRALPAIRAGKSLAITGADKVMISGHAGLLFIALDNLVRNALSHSADGSEVEIDIQAEPPSLSVLDRGPGIDPTLRDVLFERFNRGQANPPIKGSGIGLAIVKSVAMAHDAEILIHDRKNGGSRFQINFKKSLNTI
ncbi:sensor histidine kinase [Ruegeria arenilitoris]|uniref:sensor histidine kinase n=1 Tax=Ruegeria arenilitoris TaxID=1173585 RepID=UPI00147C4033|nr:HAMP domain-containing sensor histidine kinase [Ruegeria arenilitoris]